MSYWPDEINARELLTPAEILRNAGDELESRTDSMLKVEIRESKLEDRIVLVFEVKNLGAGKTLNLFEVSHQQHVPYPAAIDPPTSEIPEFLKKRKYVPGKAGLEELDIGLGKVLSASLGTRGQYVENKWVAATPREFMKLLCELLAQDDIKSRIISLTHAKGEKKYF